MQCGGTLEQFELLTLRDCLDFIITYVNINNKKNNKQDQSHQSSISFSYGRADDYDEYDEEPFRYSFFCLLIWKGCEKHEY